jgi:uncharacterized protein YjiS (DUF1127 family)
MEIAMSTMTITHTRRVLTESRSASFLAALRERLRQRRELKALLDQPDYILKDIGVSREDILRRAQIPLWRD